MTLSQIIMGGNKDGLGNVTTCAEFNFHADPEAAKVVLERSAGLCPTYIVPWETCFQNKVSEVSSKHLLSKFSILKVSYNIRTGIGMSWPSWIRPRWG